MTEEFYYTSCGQRLGPVPESKLRTLAENHVLKPNDLVWREGSPDWVPASSVPGLFGAATALQTAPSIPLVLSGGNRQDYDYQSPAPMIDTGGYPRDNYYLDQLRRRRQNSEFTIPIPWVIAGGVALLAILGLAVVLARMSPADATSGSETASLVGTANYTVDLVGDPQGVNHNGFHTKGISLNAGDRITITVTSERQSDVDLFLTDPNRTPVASDQSTSKDCYVQTTASRSGIYTIMVDNLGPGSNRSHVTYKIEGKR